MKKLILGDCLEIMKKMRDESVDLIYLDPPFFSNRNYEIIGGDKGEIASFEDRGKGGIEHYIGGLYERVKEMYRLLKETGSIYLHCDWHADAHIRVKILEPIFGEKNFKNEIIGQYFMGGKPKTYFANKHDTIFGYTKSDKGTYNELRIKRYLDFIPPLKDDSKDTENGKDNIGYFSIVKCPDVGPIKGVFNMSKEYIGYPTQKPEALLERIIKASSNEGDVVLDPFVGGGTTVAVAEKLNRNWIGIDQSVQAIKVTEQRLENILNIFISQNDDTTTFTTEQHYYDRELLFNMNPFEFERQIIHRFGGKSGRKQRGDGGIDGHTIEGDIPIQVKQSENIGRNVVDNFKSAIERDKRKNRIVLDESKKKNDVDGYIIAFSFGRGAGEEVARLKNTEGVIIKLVKVEDVISLAEKPKLDFEKITDNVDSKGNHTIEFKAAGESPVGIEFYSGDFNHPVSALETDKSESSKQFKADIILDKKGKVKWDFSPGKYNIAVKVTDNKGIDNIIVKTLQVNGISKLI